MGIRLIISVILFFSFSSRSFSKVGYLSNYWFTESFEKNIQEDNFQSIDPFLSSYAISYKDIGINQQKSLKDGSWYLSGFQTSLALGLKGKIGIHSWGGTKTIEIDWKRRAPKKTVSKERTILKNNKKLTGNKNTLFFNDKTTDEVINSKVNFIITKARNSGRVRNLTKLEGEFGTFCALSTVKRTSSALNALPSCHLTPLRSLNSHVVSLIGFQETAKSG